MQNIKIVTWNVNSIRARLLNVLNFINELKPDVILLQEIKCEEKNFPFDFFNEIGYQSFIFGQKSYNGVAIISKVSVEDLKYKLFDEIDARYIEAIILGKIRVASVYVPSGGDSVNLDHYFYKLEFLKNLRFHLNEIVKYDEDIIIGGDFNVAPTDFDVYNEETWREKISCTKKERELFEEILKSGFVDVVFKKFFDNNNKMPFTWWSYLDKKSFQKNMGLRLDHFLVTKKTVEKISDLKICDEARSQERPSDHAPVMIDVLV